ncbi:MAG: TlpA disulfide reductase family protein [Planctomycetaceae bacterium]|nr:TlpA disulfide reductase family protein [Planctomycetaceae bacterium]
MPGLWRCGSMWLAGVLACGLMAATVRAADEAPKPSETSKPKVRPLKLITPGEVEPKGADPYAVPNGTPDEIIEFLDKLQKSRKQFASRDEAVDHVIKVQKAIITAGDKILAQKVDDDTAFAAAEMKLEALGMLASADIEGMMEAALKAAKDLAKDQRKDIAELGAEWSRQLTVMNVPSLDEEERKQLIDAHLAEITASKFSRASIGQALQLGEALEQMPDTKVAGAFYADLSKLLGDAKKPGLDEVAAILKANSRRMNLPGNKMEVVGTTLAGKKFDWEQYRGKVVLVDFWATWCGPCVAELPNVKANYDKYHAQGFEVVGISLDDDREQLTAFIAEEEIPWTNLFAAPKDGQPTQQPAAEYYGITGIPTAILVDREGKVISLMARGEMLTELLEKEFAAKSE